MFYIEDGNHMKLTRGDTAYITVEISNIALGEQYVIGENDELTLTVKLKIADETPVLQKTIRGSNTFKLKPEDTANLSFRAYRYDIQLTTSDKDVYTVVEPSLFTIMQEVTC